MVSILLVMCQGSWQRKRDIVLQRAPETIIGDKPSSGRRCELATIATDPWPSASRRAAPRCTRAVPIGDEGPNAEVCSIDDDRMGERLGGDWPMTKDADERAARSYYERLNDERRARWRAMYPGIPAPMDDPEWCKSVLAELRQRWAPPALTTVLAKAAE